MQVNRVAVVGMSARFPGAADYRAFWQNLVAGVESVRAFAAPSSDLARRAAAGEAVGTFVAAGGTLDDVECFDSALFGYSRREAELLDPQQRIMLEGSWSALEDAGLLSDAEDARVGVFLGSGPNTYLPAGGPMASALEASLGELALASLHDGDFLAPRVAFHLGLTGPTVTLGTACSTSLVAVHLACQSLLAHECDVALAGGIQVHLPQEEGYLCVPGGILSPDGHCRPFDRGGQGTVRGNGAGVVVLTRVEDAEARRDPIRAVILGTAVNNDGGRGVGFVAPSVVGQVEAIIEAQEMAGVTPDTISYVEAHGTGTALGDTVEIAALRKAFTRLPWHPGACGLGSVKSNVGHLGAAAGVAGLVKTVLALEHGVLPPTLNVTVPNPDLGLDDSPFYLVRDVRAWEAAGVRRAGVSSLGAGGTNCHVVLESAEPARQSAPIGAGADAALPLLLSAASEGSLAEAAAAVADDIGSGRAELRDAAVTLAVGRKQLARRMVVSADDRGAAVDGLLGGAGTARIARGNVEGPTAIGFLFAGLGGQRRGAGAELASVAPAAAALERCVEAAAAVGVDMAGRLLSGDVDEGAPGGPAIDLLESFAVSYAIAVALGEWGIVPDVLFGYSAGEYVAATLAGALSCEDAVRVVARRGELFGRLPAGVMLGVHLGAEGARRLLPAEVDIAAVNADDNVLVSVEASSAAAVERLLRAADVEHSLLAGVDRPYHSRHVEMLRLPMLEEVFADVSLSGLRTPVLSCLTGEWTEVGTVLDPSYWYRQMRNPIRLRDAIGTIVSAKEPMVLVEVGTGTGLAGMVRRLVGRDATVEVATTTDASNGRVRLRETAAELWARGVELDRRRFADDIGGRRVPLAGYRFERTRHWLDLDGAARPFSATSSREGVRGGKPGPGAVDVAEAFYAPVWVRCAAPAGSGGAPSDAWVVLMEEGEDGPRGSGLLVDRLRSSGARVVEVAPGPSFARLGPDRYRVRATAREDYDRLLADLPDAGGPLSVCHAWTLCAQAGDDDGPLGRSFEHGYGSAVVLLQALAARPGAARVTFLTGSQHRIDDESVRPADAMLLGLAAVAGQEAANVQARCVDLGPSTGPEGGAEVVEELCTWTEEPIALRAGGRWVLRYADVPLPSAHGEARGLQPDGVYVLLGGAGRVGTVLARHLVHEVGARVAVVSRRPLAEARSAVGLGDEVLVVQGDACDGTSIRRALDRVEEELGPITGVLFLPMADNPWWPVAELDLGEVRRQLRPKVEGIDNLRAALAGRAVELVVAFSSNATVLGGLGLSSYAAANHYMEAVVADHAGDARTRWLSVSWDRFLAADEDRPDPTVMRSSMDPYAMTAAQSTEALDRLIAGWREPHAVVSFGDLGARLRTWRTEAGRAAPVATSSAGAVDACMPRGEVEELVASVWADALGHERVGRDENFFSLGGHSLLATAVAARIAAATGRTVLPSDVLAAPTVAELAARVADAPAAGGPPGCVVRLADGDAGVVVLVHPQGGTAACYVDLAARLAPAGLGVVALEAALPVDHEAASSLPAMAAAYREELRRAGVRPLVVGGWSFGGMVAWEMAVQGAAAGERPWLVAMIDTPAPGFAFAADRRRADELACEIVDDALGGAAWSDDQRASARRLVARLALGSGEHVAAARLVDQAAALRSTGVDPELLLARLSRIELHRKAAERAAPSGYDGRVLLIRASHRGSPPTVLMGHPAFADPSFGWQPYAEGELSVVELDADHRSIVRPPVVDSVADILVAGIDAAGLRA